MCEYTKVWLCVSMCVCVCVFAFCAAVESWQICCLYNKKHSVVNGNENASENINNESISIETVL